MKVAAKIYVAIPTAPGKELKAGMQLAPESCEFELCMGPGKDLFLECRFDGCFGAGLRCFSSDYLFVPDDIVEDMRVHVALWHGK